MRRLIVAAVLCVLLPLQSAFAATIETTAKQAILLDDATGTVLFEKNADERMTPSSMTKLMTIYIVMKRLHEGTLKPTDVFTVSETAWRMQGSKMFVMIGSQVSVEELLIGMIVPSGNDACTVIAEGISGSEEAFSHLMNDTAKELGMTNTHFVNSHGWPEENHYTTARDLATLAHRIIHDYPEYYHYFAMLDYTYTPPGEAKPIKQGNRNPLLYKNMGVDGLKTGHSDAGGYGVVVSGVSADKRRLILVINGTESMNARSQQSETLMRYGYLNFENKKVLATGQPLEQVPVWFGQKQSVPVAAKDELVLTMPKGGKADVKVAIDYNAPVPAPVAKGAQLATLSVTLPGGEVRKIPLYATEDVGELSPVQRIIPAISYYLLGAP